MSPSPDLREFHNETPVQERPTETTKQDDAVNQQEKDKQTSLEHQRLHVNQLKRDAVEALDKTGKGVDAEEELQKAAAKEEAPRERMAA